MSRCLVGLVMLCAAPLMSAAKPVSPSGPVLTGLWGAPGIGLTLTAQGGRIEQSCARATFGPVQPDARGRFTASGTIEYYGAGPQAADSAPHVVSAAFSGQATAGTLELTVRPKGGKVERHSLIEGRRSKIIRCL